jgi:hypothetical protein
MNPSDSRPSRAAVMYSRRPLAAFLRKPPLGRVSQVPDGSFGARRPLSPRGTRSPHMLVASRPMSGFALFGGLAVPRLCNEAETGSLALRLTPSPSGVSHLGSLRRTPGWHHVERAIHMFSSFQLKRPFRLDLTHRKNTEGHRRTQRCLPFILAAREAPVQEILAA